MRALADAGFDPLRPLQTDKGAQQALRCGHNKIDEYIKNGRLRVVYLGRLRRITTELILDVAATGDGPPPRRRMISPRPGMIA